MHILPKCKCTTTTKASLRRKFWDRMCEFVRDADAHGCRWNEAQWTAHLDGMNELLRTAHTHGSENCTCLPKSQLHPQAPLGISIYALSNIYGTNRGDKTAKETHHTLLTRRACGKVLAHIIWPTCRPLIREVVPSHGTHEEPLFRQPAGTLAPHSGGQRPRKVLNHEGRKKLEHTWHLPNEPTLEAAAVWQISHAKVHKTIDSGAHPQTR